jgi:tetratricopeptide (TPR) repeat protein
MKIKVVSLKEVIICGVFLLIVLLIPYRVVAYDFYGWSHGASGYNDAIQAAINEDKPLILYFHTEWCKWSKKMNDDYLASYDVTYMLDDIQKVEINPDKGADEKALVRKYNVTGYPSFLVSVPSIDSNSERLYPFEKGTDWTTDEFIDAIRSTLVNLYNKKGYSCYQRKQYDEAIKYYEMAISFDPEDAYAYYGKGVVHHTVAYQNRDTGLLEEAETDYLRALEIDPSHPGCKKGLKQLRITMEKLGIR